LWFSLSAEYSQLQWAGSVQFPTDRRLVAHRLALGPRPRPADLGVADDGAEAAIGADATTKAMASVRTTVEKRGLRRLSPAA
jgi:hypothetical protein